MLTASTADITAVLTWYETAARDLPWRSDPDPWGVLVSEVMLQQTPVARVLPVYQQWMLRWPQPADLASESPGEAVRAWGRLGYPRRALRLHAAATACVTEYDGAVPRSVEHLRRLPGVGEYTAAAVASFAFGDRHAVLDTNVRRVHARWLDGTEHPLRPAPTTGERERALALLPPEPSLAARASVAVMELGALVCTSRAPECDECPLNSGCAWHAAGHPAGGTARRAQPWARTDRQCRGRLMAVMRSAADAVTRSSLESAWDDAEQRDRALASLLADGLIVADGSRYRLP